MTVEYVNSSEGAGHLRQRGRADPVTVARFRSTLGEWLDATLSLSAERRADILLATDEALSNCADHAYRNRSEAGPMYLEVSLDRQESTVTVVVSDEGTWLEQAPPTSEGLRGRGTRLIRALADDVVIDATADGTTVRMQFLGCEVQETRRGRRRTGTPPAVGEP